MKRFINFFYKLLVSFFIIFGLIIIDSSCKKDDGKVELVGNWVELSDFEGVARSDAVSFVINGKGYVATGYDGDDRLSDVWEYDPATDSWLRRADFPGGARNGAVAFSTSTKGYIGTGYNGTDKLKDFWEYDPVSNSWTQIPDFPGSARYGAIAFSLNNKGYVGTGFDGTYLKDLWEYDPEMQTWLQKRSVGGSKRRDAVVFTINGEKAYICTGINNGTYEDDFWEYDPQTDIWTKKRDIANNSNESYDDDYAITRINAVAFSSNGKGYIVTGAMSSILSDVWEYNPATDLWIKKTTFEGSARTEGTAFIIADKGFVLTGRSSSYYFDDNWTFNPDDKYDDND